MDVIVIKLSAEERGFGYERKTWDTGADVS